jgi:uncharacterized protein YjgD (DUF1641 family)
MTDLLSSTPSEVLKSRLDDPKVAAALGTVLDNADTLALGLVALDGLLRRADTISDNVTSSLKDVKAIGDSVSFLAAPTKRLAQDAPQIADAAEALLDSGMLSREVVNLLGRLAGALVEGANQAQVNRTSVAGVFPAIRALKDPDVAKGLGFLIEVSRALGRTI